MGRGSDGLSLLFRMEDYLNVCMKGFTGFELDKDLNDSCREKITKTSRLWTSSRHLITNWCTPISRTIP